MTCTHGDHSKARDPTSQQTKAYTVKSIARSIFSSKGLVSFFQPFFFHHVHLRVRTGVGFGLGLQHRAREL